MPITHSSASQKGSEQRREVELRVFEEIVSFTYRDVDGFFERYFYQREWSERADEVISVAIACHDGGKWLNFPDPNQDPVLQWFSDFQQDFFTGLCSVYYTTHDRSLTGSEARRQLDLFMNRDGDSKGPCATHDWKERFSSG